MTKIYNWINKLPWHSTKRWTKRNISSIENIIVHQLASPKYENSTKDIEQNNTYFITPSENNHISKSGCPHLPYHIAIDDSGNIYICNSYESITWHAKRFNSRSIGIVLVGSFTGPSFAGKDEKPTDIQLKSLGEFLDGIKFYPNLKIENIFGHCEVDPQNKKSCPGNGAMEFLKSYRNRK